MPQTLCPDKEISLFSADSQHWFDSESPDEKRPLEWEPSELVTKIVIGTLEKAGDEPKTVSANLPDDLAALFPNLTHLYLWQIENLERLPELPQGLKCLDLRGCQSLASCHGFPAGIETLLLDDCESLPTPSRAEFPKLSELSIKNCHKMKENWLHDVLRGSVGLKRLDLSGCTQLVRIPSWPEALIDVRLNDCSRLEWLADLPSNIRRIELRRAVRLAEVPSLANTLADYVDLAYTSSLRKLPPMPMDPHANGSLRP